MNNKNTIVEHALNNLQNKIGIKADWIPKGINPLDGRNELLPLPFYVNH
ncbi:MAG: hypothetical protein ACTHK8_20485 [Ginsengibacter sp.]